MTMTHTKNKLTPMYLQSRIGQSAEVLADELVKKIRPTQTVYLMGNAADFDIFSKPIAEAISDNIVGVGCMSLEITVSDPVTDEHEGSREYVTIPFEYLEPAEQAVDFVLVCQSITSRASEIIALASRVSGRIEYRRLIVISDLMDSGTRSELEERLRRYSGTIYGAKYLDDKFAVRAQQNILLGEPRFISRGFVPKRPEWIRKRILAEYDASPGYDFN